MTDKITKVPVKKGKGRGRPALDREFIYRKLWSMTDARGVIVKTQRDVASELGIGYQRVCEIYKDFVDTGHMKKLGSQFVVRYHPDLLDWGEKFLNAHDALRKRHQNAKQREKYDPSFNKED